MPIPSCSRHLRWNPYPRGYFGDPKRECRCNPQTVQRYRQRISGPLLDRIDIHVEVPSVQFRELSRADPGEPSAVIRQRVERVRALESDRFAAHPGVACNAGMTPKLLKQHVPLTDETRGLLESSMDQMNFSARAHDRILKVARTIADLADSTDPLCLSLCRRRIPPTHRQSSGCELADALTWAYNCVVTTVQEIKSAIHALPPNEREKLIEELPAMLPELDGDAAWERIICDARPRSSLSSLLDEVAVESGRDPTSFAETSEAEFERHS